VAPEASPDGTATSPSAHKTAGSTRSVDGKVGLAYPGGGFRAAFFHVGVLARLAELGGPAQGGGPYPPCPAVRSSAPLITSC
jgi:predicted acylesterase/phospholipase RssA